MISTVTSKLDSKFSNIDAIKKSFPMGSMTGAPKISVMKLIEELEEAKEVCIVEQWLFYPQMVILILM
jgi:para-aminobenzoate synthetase component 1